jgi:hypothetical protein
MSENMVSCQTAVRQWGASSRVVFDASKEHYAVTHHTHGEGEVEHISKHANPKLTALLQKILTTPALRDLFDICKPMFYISWKEQAGKLTMPATASWPSRIPF